MLERARCIALLSLLLAAACSPEPVEWVDNQTIGGPVAVGVISGDTALTALEARVAPPSHACAGSLRLSRARGTLQAVWWSPRPDSGARLLAAHSSDDGATWSAIASVDTMDRGVSGCRRPAASIAADSASGYVHITYAMVAPEGPGLFFSHSMDNGASFHSPVPILYGERLGVTSVAAAGDHVVVGFEDPNSGTPRIGLALSRTMGHIFEDRLLPVSDDNGSATHPLVSVQGRRLTVAWRQQAAANTQPSVRVRSGNLH